MVYFRFRADAHAFVPAEAAAAAASRGGPARAVVAAGARRTWPAAGLFCPYCALPGACAFHSARADEALADGAHGYARPELPLSSAGASPFPPSMSGASRRPRHRRPPSPPPGLAPPPGLVPLSDLALTNGGASSVKTGMQNPDHVQSSFKFAEWLLEDTSTTADLSSAAASQQDVESDEADTLDRAAMS